MKLPRTITRAVFLPVLLLVVVAASACGRAESTSLHNSISIPRITRPAAILPKDRVVGDHLVTFDETNLAGKLPPARPVQAITRGNPELKRVAITIDDGWNADMRILELLKEWEIKWTAFLIGGRGIAESNPDLVRAVRDAGAEVCNHTYSHYVMSGKDNAFVVDELWRAQEAITSVTHEIYPYTRFSGGAYDDTSLQWAADQGFWMVNWTVSSGDTSKGVTVDFQVNNILGNLQPGAIILFHFGGYNTYEVLSRVIPEIQRRGYEVTSLSRVLEGTPFVLNESE
ncbi:MAG: polysaccharide deacetylase family protein [Actinobacteria bacterium]|nr:polysaccharide deacetylase family protein [Actinomycetota bacterium]MCG2817960.1 polysaccharide deacetylase family protein [Actinomycetes bacterium]MBU4217548.1 polysaccharide deacetylase family protein [Actinomycetota bacterium]MBU4360117.1 polysaccharide deacetylase family protein [Actinomycetota bacterium]MBU4391745.1 polysaccharide deacetylase family protein [Actinomycetota bacterium]